MSEIQTTPKVSLRDRGMYFLSANFDATSANAVVTWILESNFEKSSNYDHLTLIINSPGGHVSAAFSMIDMMNGSKLPVHTLGLGMIASCGLLTFMAGKHRILTPNTAILSHQFSAGAYGKEHELLAGVKEFTNTEKRLFDHYKRCTKLSDKIIREKLLCPSDTWLTGAEAKKYNICDEIRNP
jgi:ATP-dependent Clp protease protease subunit